jgi:predicted GNAT family acetyltransferase
MANLTHASRQLFARSPDERFANMQDLAQHCRAQKAASIDRWQPPQHLSATAKDDRLVLTAGSDGAFELSDWSFNQLCGLARVNKDTVNRLTPETAARVFGETMPTGQKPMQLLTTGTALRSIHGVAYTRLWNLDLVNVIREYATDFQPPQPGMNGGTGLYCGEQDMFCFLIDPTGWAEIDGQAFAPGFFAWNSEVGKRSIGISTFWFQAVCQNHIVWDAVEVTEVNRKHTAGVHSALGDVRRTLETLIQRRDERRDGFVAVMQKAMKEKLGADAEEVSKVLAKQGINRQLAKQALELARQNGAFTIFAVVDALTRLAQDAKNAGERLEMDQQAATLLDLVSPTPHRVDESARSESLAVAT